MGFTGSSVGNKSVCNAGDPESIPGLARVSGEGIGYPLQYCWASLVVQLVNNPLAMQETWVWSLGWDLMWPFPPCCCLVDKLCPTLCNPMDCRTPGFPVLHCLLEFAQIHVHWVGDAIYLIISSSAAPFSICPHLFWHQDLFQWIGSLHQVLLKKVYWGVLVYILSFACQWNYLAKDVRSC